MRPPAITASLRACVCARRITEALLLVKQRRSSLIERCWRCFLWMGSKYLGNALFHPLVVIPKWQPSFGQTNERPLLPQHLSLSLASPTAGSTVVMLGCYSEQRGYTSCAVERPVTMLSAWNTCWPEALSTIPPRQNTTASTAALVLLNALVWRREQQSICLSSITIGYESWTRSSSHHLHERSWHPIKEEERNYNDDDEKQPECERWPLKPFYHGPPFQAEYPLLRVR